MVGVGAGGEVVELPLEARAPARLVIDVFEEFFPRPLLYALRHAVCFDADLGESLGLHGFTNRATKALNASGFFFSSFAIRARTSLRESTRSCCMRASRGFIPRTPALLG